MQLNIALVGTLYSSNIGASARALANMGGNELILIDPKCTVNSQARRGAAGAQFLLDKRKSYKNWEAFLEDHQNSTRIALSARKGKLRNNLPLQETLAKLIQRSSEEKISKKVVLIFGPEDNGLSLSDLEHCHEICHLPTFGEFTSLNLAQAVLIASLLFNLEFNKKSFDLDLSEDSVEFPETPIKTWLQLLGFDLTAPKKNIFFTFKKMILRSHPSADELRLLNSIANQNIRKLESTKKTSF